MALTTEVTSETLIDQLIQSLRKQKQKLAVAESCTGGLLSSWITRRPGVSDVFQGGAVVYSNISKQKILGVSSSDLANQGAVSEEVASQMARGVKDQFVADWGVAITGVAGPSGGTPEKPVGIVCFAVAGPKIVKTEKKHFAGDRQEVQTASALFASQFLLNELNL